MTRFVPDSALDYRHQTTSLNPDEGLLLDLHYRRAHLPLVAPDHPDLIAEAPEQGYRMGRHMAIWSLVMPVPWDILADSCAFRLIDSEIRASPLAGKISWTRFEQRKAVLHATICGSLATGTPPRLTEDQRAALTAISPFAVALRGLFSGSVNRGRLYLKVYPEERQGENCVQLIQKALGARQTALYVVGLYNLTDHLDAREAAWLAACLHAHKDSDIATPRVEELWLMGVRDDLALDSEVAEIIRLG